MNSRSGFPRDRAGRFLVECLVAIIVLGASAMVVTSLTHSMSWAMQTAQSTSLAWSQSNAVIESGFVAPCVVGTAAGAVTGARTQLEWVANGTVSWRQYIIAVRFTPSALIASTGVPLIVRAAQECP